jgi:hypothetical protein
MAENQGEQGLFHRNMELAPRRSTVYVLRRCFLWLLEARVGFRAKGEAGAGKRGPEAGKGGRKSAP